MTLDVLMMITTIFVIVALVVVIVCFAVVRGRQPPPPQQTAQTVDQMRPLVVYLLEQGKKIEAIKEVRQATRLGLQEAKDAVDAIAAEEGIDRRGRRR